MKYLIASVIFLSCLVAQDKLITKGGHEYLVCYL